MMKLDSKIIDILKDPSQAYDRPQDVILDQSLKLQEKIKILRCWEEDVEALLRAEEENMPAPYRRASGERENIGPRTTGDLLATISKLREDLELSDSGDKTA